jgi:hypothetical protein
LFLAIVVVLALVSPLVAILSLFLRGFVPMFLHPILLLAVALLMVVLLW